MVLGLIAVADNFVPWYLGPGYLKAANLIKLLSPIIIIIGFSNVFGLQFLIPSGQDKRFSFAVVIGATINFILNLLLIRWLASYGAVIATVIAEFVVTVVMLAFIRKNISVVRILKESWRYWICGTIMFVVCYLLGSRLSPSIIHTGILIVVGGLIYFTGIVITKDDFVWSVFRRIKR